MDRGKEKCLLSVSGGGGNTERVRQKRDRAESERRYSNREVGALSQTKLNGRK